MSDTLQFVLTCVLLGINNVIVVKLYRHGRKRQHKKQERQFIRQAQIAYPGSIITFIAVNSSEKEVMADIERQLRDAAEAHAESHGDHGSNERLWAEPWPTFPQEHPSDEDGQSDRGLDGS